MKRLMILMSILVAGLLCATCSEEIPPVAPQPGKADWEPPQEIDDPSPGGGGSPTYNYMWVPLPEVKDNFFPPSGGGSISVQGQRLKDYANSHAFVWDYGTIQTDFCPVLVNQNAEADQLCLALAIYYGCDPGAPPSFYDDAWHAIRSMMRQWYNMPALAGWCQNGWIGMARNLLPYLVAADYLNSLGPIGTNGLFGYNNQQTFDSLKVFAQRFRDADPSVKAPAAAGCGRIHNLRDMCWPQADQPGLGTPDNKGAAALASYLGATIFYKNRQPVVSAWYDSVQKWYKAWYAYSQDSHFNNNRFEGNDNWQDSWIQQDGISGNPQPILSVTAAPRKWPYNCTGSPPSCFTWNSMGGAVTDDLYRGGTPSSTAATVPPTSPAALIYDSHVSGITVYMVNAAELLYQDGIPWGDQFGWASNGPERTASWHDLYALIQDEKWPDPPGVDWPKLKNSGDDWPCTYILRDRGFTWIESGTNVAEGKQISFTDLTHRP